MEKEINSDYLLWKRIKAGETQAFQDLYMKYADVLFSFGMIYSRDQELVKDSIHDLFFDLYKYRKNLSDNDHIRNYLFKSLKRKIQSVLKSKMRLVYTNEIHDGAEGKSDFVVSETEDLTEENLKEIQQAVDKLSEHQQEVLKLRFQIGLSYDEVARILDISVESVRTLVYRTIKSLREQLKTKNNTVVLLYLHLIYNELT
jgi:RNA polymerase sigma factor, sigma-70 family